MAIINYQYGEMLAKADEFDSVLPSLIEDGNWMKIREMLTISETMWSGSAANAFAQASLTLCDARSKGVLELPEKIRNSVHMMQERERVSAENVRRMLGSDVF